MTRKGGPRRGAGSKRPGGPKKPAGQKKPGGSKKPAGQKKAAGKKKSAGSRKPTARKQSAGSKGQKGSHGSKRQRRSKDSKVGAHQILRYVTEAADRPLKPKELAQALGVRRTDYPDFRSLLQRLVADGKLYRQRHGRLGAPQDLNLAIGRLEVTRAGHGFVVPDDGPPDIFVRARDLGGAVEGDRVVARVEQRPEDRNPRGRVIQILERAHSEVVGIFHARPGYAWVEAHEPKLGVDFFVPPTETSDADEGDLVLLEVMDWGDGDPRPVGRISRVLGAPGDPGVEVLAIQLGYELPESFSPQVEEAAALVAQRGLRPEDIEGREDFRQELVYTIDPADARDHDDAVSIQPLKDGTTWVGIHIADVSHYVQEGGPIDLEAWERATSVYLVDRVIPMLPHALSSDLCSLVPDENRLTLSVLLRVDPEGQIVESRFARSVIRSRHRLSYDDAQAILDGEREAPPELTHSLRELLRVSRAFRRQRLERGSLDFDLPEARVILDAAGEPQDVQRVLRLPAHQLIEDLMIAANEAIPQWAIREGIPLLYRIHEDPDPERIESLQTLAAEFGLSVPRSGVRPIDLQRLLNAVQGETHESLISMATLRSLARARYSPGNEGHFGLASSAYAHFTSPIRRYPDLVVHRQLSRWIEAPASARSMSLEWLDATARQASARERSAAEAERDSIELKKIQFMERHLGDHFEATISGVASFGFFVLLDRYQVDGLVHVSSLGDDYYRFDEAQHALVGRRRKQKFRLGDAVEVQVVRVNREERKIDFQLVE
jgi:ribonuclease R